MKIEARQLIPASADRLFAFTQDYSKRLSWDPFLREAVLLGDAGCAGPGVRSWCVAWFGLGMESEYVSFHPPKVVAVKMTRGPWIFRRFAASWSFHEVTSLQTEVVFAYSFQLQACLRIMTPLARGIIRYEMKRRLLSLRKVFEVAGP